MKTNSFNSDLAGDRKYGRSFVQARPFAKMISSRRAYLAQKYPKLAKRLADSAAASNDNIDWDALLKSILADTASSASVRQHAAAQADDLWARLARVPALKA